MSLWLPVAALALLTACGQDKAKEASGGVPAAAAARATPINLQPMTDADGAIFGSGCNCAFQTDTAILMQYGVGQDGRDLVAMRIDGALLQCPVTPVDMEVISSGEGAFQCGDFRVWLNPKGAVEQGDDSHGRDVTLTLTGANRTVNVDGSIACAC